MNRKRSLTLAAAGLLFLLGCLVRGAHVFPSGANAGRFAEWTAGFSYTAGYFLLVGAVTLSVFGYVTLRARVGGRLAGAAMVLSILGAQFLLVLFGGAMIMSPALGAAYTGGWQGAVEVAGKALAGGTVTLIGMGILMNVVGHVLFAAAIWRSPGHPKLATAPLALAPIFLCLPFYYPIELLGGALFLVAGALLATRAA